jgi:hypothetical protein
LRDVNATDSPWESARRSFYLVPKRSLDDDRLELYVSPATLDEHEADTFREHDFVNVLSPWSSLVAR